MEEKHIGQASMPDHAARVDGPWLDQEKLITGRKAYWAMRRLQDVVLSILALAVLTPFMLLIMAIILVDDPKGSPIFRQERVGKDGKHFMMFKFRTMVVGAEEQLPALMRKHGCASPSFKLENDPRITRVGGFLRKTSIDELPQLINIIKGEMSIVGPRPVVQREVDQYDAYQRQRLLITPGLTCFWQIQPHRNCVPFDQWVEMDLRYIRERSFLTDWRIIFGTIRAVLNMEGL